MNEHDPLLRELEALIDGHGARAVLEAFSEIAWGKAEHLQANWQDEQSAKHWSRLARKLCGVVDWARDVVGM